MYRSRKYSQKYCPVCGRAVYTTAFDGYCDSGCVEIAVDEAIERKHELRQMKEDRDNSW